MKFDYRLSIVKVGGFSFFVMSFSFALIFEPSE